MNKQLPESEQQDAISPLELDVIDSNNLIAELEDLLGIVIPSIVIEKSDE